jgi:hypothetical protein
MITVKHLLHIVEKQFEHQMRLNEHLRQNAAKTAWTLENPGDCVEIMKTAKQSRCG